jgi:hypothetical protein
MSSVHRSHHVLPEVPAHPVILAVLNFLLVPVDRLHSEHLLAPRNLPLLSLVNVVAMNVSTAEMTTVVCRIEPVSLQQLSPASAVRRTTAPPLPGHSLPSILRVHRNDLFPALPIVLRKLPSSSPSMSVTAMNVSPEAMNTVPSPTNPAFRHLLFRVSDVFLLQALFPIPLSRSSSLRSAMIRLIARAIFASTTSVRIAPTIISVRRTSA